MLDPPEATIMMGLSKVLCRSAQGRSRVRAENWKKKIAEDHLKEANPSHGSPRSAAARTHPSIQSTRKIPQA